MDEQALIDCWTVFESEHRSLLERVLFNPVLRPKLVRDAPRICRTFDEEEIMWALMRLRKKKCEKFNRMT